MNGDSRGTLGGQGQRDGGSSLQSLSYLREENCRKQQIQAASCNAGGAPRRRPSVPSTVLASHSRKL